MATRREERRDVGTMDPIAEWESTGSREALVRLIEACRHDPEMMLRLSARDLELFRLLQENRKVLAEAKEALEEKQNAVRQVAAFIAQGPVLQSGAPTALVDRGGQRCVVALAEGVSLNELHEKPTVLLNHDGSLVVGTLDDYEPPAEVGRVVEAQNGHVLVEFHADEQVRVDVPYRLRGQFREGDRALVDRRHHLVIRRMEGVESQSEWLLEECPPERFSDVAGQEEALRYMRERVFYPLEHPDLIDLFHLRPSVGILLFGPTGCGKTHIARATAGELHERFSKDFIFLRVAAGAIKSKWYSETTHRIKRLWQFARTEAKKGRTVIIYLEECDSLGSTRAAYGGEYGLRADHDATNAWLSEMEGIDSDRSLRILCIASTNFEKNLDAAFLSRHSLKVPVRRPDAEGTGRMLGLHLNHGVSVELPSEQMIEQAVDFIFHDKANALLIAHLRDGKQVETIRRSHLVSGRLVRDAVENSKWLVVRDVVENGEKPVLRAEHLLQALDEQFTEMARKMTPWNVAEFVDLPSVRDGQVARLAPVVSASAGWQYVA